MIILSQALHEGIAAVANVAGLQLLRVDLLMPGLPRGVGRLHLVVQASLLRAASSRRDSPLFGKASFRLLACVAAFCQCGRGGQLRLELARRQSGLGRVTAVNQAVALLVQTQQIANKLLVSFGSPANRWSICASET